MDRAILRQGIGIEGIRDRCRRSGGVGAAVVGFLMHRSCRWCGLCLASFVVVSVMLWG